MFNGTQIKINQTTAKQIQLHDRHSGEVGGWWVVVRIGAHMGMNCEPGNLVVVLWCCNQQ